MLRRRTGAIVEKVGMTALFLDTGERVPVTLLRMQECHVVAHRKDRETGEVVALQMSGGGPRKNVTKPLGGHFSRAGVSPQRKLKEFDVSPDAVIPVGTPISLDYFPVGQWVDITGLTIGRGFAGGMKRHNFKGLGASHGVSISHRSIGSTGNRKDPSRTFKNKKMPGQLGSEQVTIQNLRIVAVERDLGVIAVRGAVPGSAGGFLYMRDAIKKPLMDAQVSIPVAPSLQDGQQHSPAE